MSEGFRNPIVGGGGGLVYPSIHSPNYAVGMAGWSINKDGSAEFNSVTVRGTIIGGQFIGTGTGSEVLIYSGTPAAGNLILSVSSGATSDSFGNHVLQGFTSYSNGFGMAINITNNAITIYGGSLAAGWTSTIHNIPFSTTILSVSATNQLALNAHGSLAFVTISADALGSIQLIVGGTTIGQFTSSGLAITGATTAASFQASSFVSTPALTVTNQGQFNAQGSAPGASSGNAVVYANTNGMLSALMSTDGNHYSLLSGTKTYDGPGQLVNSTAFTQVGSLVFNVLAGVKYKYRAMAFYTSTFAAGNPVFSFGHPALAMTNVWAHEEFSLSGGAVSQTNSDLSFLDVNGPTLNTGRTCYKSEGEFQPSANGAVGLGVACTVAADTWTVLRAMFTIEPTEG